MAKTLTEKQADQKYGRPPKYPWEKWTDGRLWEATQGDDFRCSIFGFVATLHGYAKRNGLKVTTNSSNSTVAFQFTQDN